MRINQKIKWLGTLAALLFALIPQMRAQEIDDLQEYLDQLASQQTESQARSRPRKGQEIDVPSGLTEVNLSQFTSYQSRTKTVTVKANVKFTNGTISAASNYSGGTCLLKVYSGATVVLDATAGINASAASPSNCLAAVGIYDGSTFYECGDITAPNNGEGIAIYIDGKNDTFNYVSGKLTGSISNPNGGIMNGLEKGGWYKLKSRKMTLNGSSRGEYMLLRSDGYLDWNNKADGNLTIAVYIDSSDDNTLRFYDNANNYQKITYMEGNTVKLLAENGITRTFTITEGNYELEELKADLTAIAAQIDALDSDLTYFQVSLDQIRAYITSAELNTLADAVTELENDISTLKLRYIQLQSESSQPDIDLVALRTSIVSLQQKVNIIAAELNSLKESIKSQLVTRIQNELDVIAQQLHFVQGTIADSKTCLDQIKSQIGTGFFMSPPTDEFNSMLVQAYEAIASDAAMAEQLVSLFNDLFNGITISTTEQALTLYQSLAELKKMLEELEANVSRHKEDIKWTEAMLGTFEVNFPNGLQAFAIRPIGLSNGPQIGYKQSLGFVLCSNGMMWFEQKEGADFYLKDDEGHYIVATSDGTTQAGTKAEATVWTGQSIGNGNYTFYSKSTRHYLGYSGINVNDAIIASTTPYGWTITESMDDLQAFIDANVETGSVVTVDLSKFQSVIRDMTLNVGTGGNYRFINGTMDRSTEFHDAVMLITGGSTVEVGAGAVITGNDHCANMTTILLNGGTLNVTQGVVEGGLGSPPGVIIMGVPDQVPAIQLTSPNDHFCLSNGTVYGRFVCNAVGADIKFEGGRIRGMNLRETDESNSPNSSRRKMPPAGRWSPYISTLSDIYINATAPEDYTWGFIDWDSPEDIPDAFDIRLYDNSIIYLQKEYAGGFNITLYDKKDGDVIMVGDGYTITQQDLERMKIEVHYTEGPPYTEERESYLKLIDNKVYLYYDDLQDYLNTLEDTGDFISDTYYHKWFKNTDWQSLYLPFDINYEDWADNFEVAQFDGIDMIDNQPVFSATIMESGKAKANTPYLIRAKNDGSTLLSVEYSEANYSVCSVSYSTNDATYTFTGNYEEMTGMCTAQQYRMLGGWLAMPTSDSEVLPPYRWYMTKMIDDSVPSVESQGLKIRIHNDDDATVVDEIVNRQSSNSKCYDLQGRKVTEAQIREGLYIINNKKYFIK